MAAVNAVGRAAGLEPLEVLEDARAAELYRRHARRVLAYCRSRLARREDAEDAVQTTFLHAVDGLRKGVAPSVEIAWLLGIARNVCLARLESAGRRGRLELVCDPIDLERSEAPSSARDELFGLEDALARLPEQQRRAVLLRDWRGLSYEEVAAQLGVTLANAETLIFRGRRTLAELLREEPAATRRRLASLGNAGSLLTWAKTSFGAAAAASKLAAAAAVVVVSAAGVAAGSGALERDPAPPAEAPPARSAPATADPAPSRGARPAPARTTPRNTESQGSKAPSPRPRARANSAPAADRPAGETPSPPERAGGAVPQGSTRSGPHASGESASTPRPIALPSAVTAPVRTTVETAQGVVETIVLPVAPVTEAVTETVVAVVEPVAVPPAPPVVEEVVAAVPPVNVTAPVAVEPPKLPKLLP